VLLLVALALLVWIAVSLAVGPLLGALLRRCDVEEQRNSVGMLRAKAQHPANHAA
jgi:F0F1-type ATP synthase membrane subunit b/b'